MDILMKEVSTAPQKAVPVFHGHGCATPVVIFHGRDANELVHVLKWRVKQRPIPDQGPAWQGYGFEIAFFGSHDLSSHRMGRLREAGEGETTDGVVDGVVRHRDGQRISGPRRPGRVDERARRREIPADCGRDDPGELPSERGGEDAETGNTGGLSGEAGVMG